MAYEVKRVSEVDFLCVAIRSRGMIWVLKRAFDRFRCIAAEVAAAFGANDGRESFRFNRREGINNDIFDPVSMVTRTAAIPVPIARSCEWFVGLWFQRLLVHRATP